VRQAAAAKQAALLEAKARPIPIPVPTLYLSLPYPFTCAAGDQGAPAQSNDALPASAARPPGRAGGLVAERAARSSRLSAAAAAGAAKQALQLEAQRRALYSG